LLQEVGVGFDESIRDALRRHASLIREWNAVASLVSARDAGRVEEIHTVDALSLAPLLIRHGWGNGLLDIGSGAGFPAIPLKILFPDLPVVLVERSAKKWGFLRRVVGVLGLQGVEICHGEFPQAVAGFVPGVITARAVEKPARVFGEIIARLGLYPRGGVFLCQSRVGVADLGPMFHVEPWEEEWSRAGLRRGRLQVIWRSPELLGRK